jgi:hypothetical protein
MPLNGISQAFSNPVDALGRARPLAILFLSFLPGFLTDQVFI